MPWVRFTAAFNWNVKHNVTICYKADQTYLVKQACADQAVQAGKAVLASRPEVSHDQRR